MRIHILEIIILSMCGLHWCVFTPVVEVSQGKLRGLRSESGQNRYYGIQYATSERFQHPKDPPKWKGIFNAINPFVRCPQQMFSLITGVEDCLYLDVYAPEWAKPSGRVPVMVFFHGGAYYQGSKELYDPQFLVMKGAVVVIVNYRLGVLGFMCLNGVSNLGLRDQVAALKWVQRNIAAFGGDPDNVTLCGQSAGASSASLHLFSDLSKGLFHKAILMSGTALSTWAFNVEPITAALDDARKISHVSTEKDLFDVFSRVPLSKLIRSTHGTSSNPRCFKYSPCVDVNFTLPFFKDTPYSTLKSKNFNHVPLMVGYTDAEGGFFYGLLNEQNVNDLRDNFNDRLPSVFSWCSDEDRRVIGKMIRSHYFGNRSIDYLASVKSLVEFYSDWIAYGTINAFSRLMTQYSDQPVYNYQFSYEGGREYGKAIIDFNGIDFNGTTHTGELFYIFKPFGLPLPVLGQDRTTSDRMTLLIRNFMKYGNPTPKKTPLLPMVWPPANSTSSNIMVLDDKVEMISRPRRRQRGDFFLKMLCTYGQDGYVPCDSKQMCSPR